MAGFELSLTSHILPVIHIDQNINLIMANNSIQSAVAIADAYVVSDNHCGRGFYQRLARRVFPATKMADQRR